MLLLILIFTKNLSYAAFKGIYNHLEGAEFMQNYPFYFLV